MFGVLLWSTALKTTEAKRRLLPTGQLEVKKGRCIILHPNDAEVLHITCQTTPPVEPFKNSSELKV